MTQLLLEVGFYGKLPCRGDFLQRRAPQPFVDVWDSWLQCCLHETQQKLQDAWLTTYLTGPVWRFVLSGGVCGEGAYAGILVPSVDRVGRYFPLTVLAQLDTNDCPLGIACGSTAWFESAEALVLDALEAEALDFDTFDEQVALLRDGFDRGAASDASLALDLLQRSAFPGGAAQWQMPLGSGASLQSAVTALAYRELTRAIQPLALWWTQGSTALSPSCLATRGLPEPRAFVAMLDADWTGAEWTCVRGEGRS